ncbi:nucleolar and coiled-body phosphoprotein 1-like [Rhineura floridana]|uniref:nucleolar and coiled-body phosphoprotein 1-like n=1 Tax=Rhineura floridana TaxID=261503 RepID=UPI002AC83A52|nr:nucleolar and coiled-body phosphoprotein 1-like [Rhineura floridana]
MTMMAKMAETAMAKATSTQPARTATADNAASREQNEQGSDRAKTQAATAPTTTAAQEQPRHSGQKPEDQRRSSDDGGKDAPQRRPAAATSGKKRQAATTAAPRPLERSTTARSTTQRQQRQGNPKPRRPNGEGRKNVHGICKAVLQHHISSWEESSANRWHLIALFLWGWGWWREVPSSAAYGSVTIIFHLPLNNKIWNIVQGGVLQEVWGGI